ncbi:MAG: hypothetical protein IMX01_03410 [Limnochordaceae bacterium]|nr:hypothetical protein [Limnochordaceae bacterium]
MEQPAATGRRLQLIVEHGWVVENLHQLGPGSMYHLAYATAHTDPQVLDDIRNGLLGPGAYAEIVLLQEGHLHPVGAVEISQINDYLSYVRFDFRLLELKDDVPPPPQGARLLCRYV